ncbi:MAG: hypothetical protein ACTHK7_13055 [Aureliella sp.]
MSNPTRAGAPETGGAPAGRMLRFDRAHRGRRQPGEPLTWTAYVQPHSADLSLAATLPPAVSALAQCVSAYCAAPDGAAADPCYVSRSVSPQPVLQTLQRDRDVPTGVRRQRFYPEQWRRLQQPAIERLLKAHGQSLQWIGWERSLPQLYLPVGHLTRVILDLLHMALRMTEPAGALAQPMRLRVGSQIGAARAVVLVLEHPRLELSPQLMQYASAPVLHRSAVAPAPRDAEELARVRTLLGAIGGSLTASRSRNGGTEFRVSLPADDRMTLVKSWLERAAHEAIASGPVANEEREALAAEQAQAPIVYQAQLSLFILGRRQAETIAELDRADARLQSRAGSGDFVYRAARGRWLWLSMYGDLPELGEGEACQSQRISRWSFLAGATLLSEQQSVALHSLARAVVSKMDSVLGPRVPPLDVLTAPPSRLRHLRVDRPSAAGRLPHHRGGAARQSARPSLHAGSTPSTGQRRWRYPI